MAAPEPQKQERTQDAALVWLVVTTMAPYWRQVLLALVLLAGMAMLSVVPPYLLQRAIDGPIATGNPRGLWWIAALYAGSVLLTFALQFGQTYFLQLSGQRALADLRRRLFDHMLRQSLDFFNRQGVGELVSYSLIPKLAFEYGVVAGGLFVVFLLVSMLRGAPWKIVPGSLVFMTFFLSGALLQPQTAFLAWLFTVLGSHDRLWLQRSSDPPERTAIT